MAVREFVWEFDAPVEAVWPSLADTQRFNEAAGLPKHKIREEMRDDGSVRFFAQAKVGAVALAWEEVPVEWVHGKWFRHERRFSRGPLASIVATAEFENLDAGDTASGRSRCRYTLEATPANLLGRVVLATRFFPSAEKNFATLAAQINRFAAGLDAHAYSVKTPSLSAEQADRLDRLVDAVEASGNGHGLARRLADHLVQSMEVDLERIRPRALARQWGKEPQDVIECCLQAVREGVLESRWDLLCPRCRGAKLTTVSLDRLPTEAHCPSCNVGYDRDFARNVELSFHPAPGVRPVDDGEFCLFGPMSTPHVMLQVAVGPGEETVLPAAFEAGPMRYRTLETGGESDVDLDGGAIPAMVAEGGRVIAGDPSPDGKIRLVNHEARRRVFIVESRAWIADALTGQEVTTLQAFRDLFATDSLKPGDEVSISQIALMFTDLRGSTALYERIGDAAAYRLVREHFAFLGAIVRRHHGAIVKTIGDAVMAAFSDPADATRAALEAQAAIADFNRVQGQSEIAIKIGVHAGHCIAVTLNDRLDYFGSMVNLAARVQGLAEGGEVVLTAILSDDPSVAPLLPPGRREKATVRGFAEPVDVMRLMGETGNGR